MKMLPAKLNAMALALPRLRHPNRQPFRGVLTLVDAPSDRAPAGARGHRVLLTRAAAEAAVPSLLGMGLDFTASFDGHDVRKKVGIITQADVVDKHFPNQNAVAKQDSLKGHGFSRAITPARQAASAAEGRPAKLMVHGFIFARDFPEVVREIRLGSNALGMSYEIAEARVRDLRDRVWLLDEVTFTGAAVLRRDKAAYSQTSIELISETKPSARERQSSQTGGVRLTMDEQENNMTPELTRQFVETSSRLAAAAESLEQALTRLDSGHDALSSKVERIIAAVEENAESGPGARIATLEARIAELERANSDLKAQAARGSARKTLPPLVTALLAKHGLEAQERVDLATLDKTLSPLSVEQRIAVKAQMARAGIID